MSFSSSSTLAPLHKKKCLPPNFESTFQSFARIRNIFCSPLHTMVLQTKTIFYVLLIIWTFSPFILWLHLEKFLAVFSFFLKCRLVDFFGLSFGPWGTKGWLVLDHFGSWVLTIRTSYIRSHLSASLLLKWYFGIAIQNDILVKLQYRPALTLKRTTRHRKNIEKH